MGLVTSDGGQVLRCLAASSLSSLNLTKYCDVNAVSFQMETRFTDFMSLMNHISCL